MQTKLSDIVKQFGSGGGMFRFLRQVDVKRLEFGQKLRARSADIGHPNSPLPFKDWVSVCEAVGLADWAGRIWMDLVGDLKRNMPVSNWHELWAEAHGTVPPSRSLVGEPFSFDDSEGIEDGKDIDDADLPEAGLQTK